jgi:hypothetical protein
MGLHRSLQGIHAPADGAHLLAANRLDGSSLDMWQRLELARLLLEFV